MNVQIDVPAYRRERGLEFVWEDDFQIEVQADADAVVVRANAAGLVSLARHLLSLAQAEVPSGYHFHLDESNSLESGSSEIIFEKTG